MMVKPPGCGMDGKCRSTHWPGLKMGGEASARVTWRRCGLGVWMAAIVAGKRVGERGCVAVRAEWGRYGSDVVDILRTDQRIDGLKCCTRSAFMMRYPALFGCTLWQDRRTSDCIGEAIPMADDNISGCMERVPTTYAHIDPLQRGLEPEGKYRSV